MPINLAVCSGEAEAFMEIILSYRAQQRIGSDAARLEEVRQTTALAFKLCGQIGLHEAQNIKQQNHQIRQNTDRLMGLLRREPPVVDVEATDASSGATLLHVVADSFFPPVSVVGTLLQQGADLHAQRRDNGETPLHTALRQMSLSLHEQGKKQDVIRAYYTTQMGQGGGEPGLLRNSYFHRQGQRHLLCSAELLLCYGANLHIPDRQGVSPLSFALAATQLGQGKAEAARLAEKFEQSGNQAAQALMTRLQGQSAPHLLLQVANAGRLPGCLLHTHWPYDIAETLAMVEMLAPCLRQELAPELTALLARHVPVSRIFCEGAQQDLAEISRQAPAKAS